MNRLFHWLGHAFFNTDCAVHVQDHTQFLYCKKCGRDVSMHKGMDFSTTDRKPILSLPEPKK